MYSRSSHPYGMSLRAIGDSVSIANDMELIGYTVGYIMEGWDGVTILDRKFFLYQSGDSLCEELLQTYGYVNPWNTSGERNRILWLYTLYVIILLL